MGDKRAADEEETQRRRRVSSFYSMKQAEIDSAVLPRRLLPEVLQKLKEHEERIAKLESALLRSEKIVQERKKSKSRV